MFQIAAVLFVVTALGGATLFVLRARNGNPPLPFAFAHGALALTSLVVLAIATFRHGFGGLPALALGLFALAATGGLFLITRHLKGLLIPVPIVLLHAIVALSGLTTLLAFAFE